MMEKSNIVPFVDVVGKRLLNKLKLRRYQKFYKDYDIVKDNNFSQTSQFKELFDKNATTINVPGYLDSVKTIFMNGNKALRINKNEDLIGYVSLQKDGDSCYVSMFVDNEDYDCLRYFIKHIDQPFLRKAFGANVKIETLYFISYNQKGYEEMLSNCLRHFATEFYKEIEICEKPKNDIILIKNNEDVEYKFIDAHNKFNSDRLKQLDKEFFVLDSRFCEISDDKYKLSTFDFLLKITKNEEEIGFVGFDFKEKEVLIAPYIEKSERGSGLYSYLIKHINKCTYNFPQSAQYLAAYVPVKNKASTEAHARLFDGVSFKCFRKDI